MEKHAEENGKKTVLLVEDDEKLAALVKEYLEAGKDLYVRLEHRGDAAVDRILDERPDLVILDIMLPGMDGLAICRAVRGSYGGPILMLTALSDEVDEIVGLEIGADDYLAKPVSPRMLATRVKALLRRFERADAWADRSKANRIEIGPLTVDSAVRSAWIDGEEIPLTTTEFDLLWFLADHAGEVVKRELLYTELRGIEWDGADRSIDLRVARLRKKLGDDGKHAELIKSVRGTGYILAVTS